MKEVKVSVLLNNYNYGEYIAQAITSVFQQTYQEWEIIIVDDGSSDYSKKVIMEYAAQYPDRITAVFKPNAGQASAFNVGFALAHGDVIAFLDSDDYWFPQKLEIIMKLHERFDFVGHKQADPDQPFLRPCMYFQERRSEIFRLYGLGRLYHVFTSQMSFSKNLLEAILPMPEKGFRVCADEYVLFHGLYLSNLKYCEKELSFYRIHERNAVYGRKQINRKEIEKRNFDTIYQINEKLIRQQKPPIPYWNLHLQKKYLENEERFYIYAGRSYVIFGTGSASEKVKEYIEYCGGKILYYTGSNKKEWGKEKDGIKIFPLCELNRERKSFDKIVIGSSWIDEICEILNHEGFLAKKDYIYSEMAFW